MCIWGKYEEYTVPYVPPEDIVAIYIPQIFRSRLSLPLSVGKRVTWCGMQADWYGDDGKPVPADGETIRIFAETAEILSTEADNFFRGKRGREVFDLYNIRYSP